MAISEGLQRDRAVDESGNQLSVFNRVGARPMNKVEADGMYKIDGKLFTVTMDKKVFDPAVKNDALTFKISDDTRKKISDKRAEINGLCDDTKRLAKQKELYDLFAGANDEAKNGGGAAEDPKIKELEKDVKGLEDDLKDASPAKARKIQKDIDAKKAEIEKLRAAGGGAPNPKILELQKDVKGLEDDLKDAPPAKQRKIQKEIDAKKAEIEELKKAGGGGAPNPAIRELEKQIKGMEDDLKDATPAKQRKIQKEIDAAKKQLEEMKAGGGAPAKAPDAPVKTEPAADAGKNADQIKDLQEKIQFEKNQGKRLELEKQLEDLKKSSK